jgi:hypothetical protein
MNREKVYIPKDSRSIGRAQPWTIKIAFRMAQKVASLRWS